MSATIPLGKAESERLEFKGKDARPMDIAREVVAFLNARGGEIWWGIREEGGRATAEDALQDAEALKRDLINHLIDTIEPSPAIPGDVTLELVPAIGEGHVMRIKVRELTGDRAPAAQFREQGRRYWTRVGDRLRIMSREEIAAKFRETKPTTERVEDQLLDERRQVQLEKKPRFWMKIQPSHEWDWQAFDSNDPALRDLLMNPTASGNRRDGWNVLHELKEPKLRSNGVRHGYDDEEYVELQKTGSLELRVPLERFHWKGGERELWPYALLEFPVSLFRLASKFFETWGAEQTGEVLVDFTFVELRGWSLRRGSPRRPRYGLAPEIYGEFDHLAPPKPFRFQREEVVAEPDRCGARVIAFVYEAFGYGEDAIPPELDREKGRLVISTH